MSDPQEVDRGLYQPTQGSDVGTWSQPLNANFGATGSMFGNIAVIGLTNANVTLTTPPNSGASWSGPYQSQSAVLRFTGALTGNCVVTIPVSGFFIVENLCTGAFTVTIASPVPSAVVCAPPGEPCHIIVNASGAVKYVDMGRVGSYLDMAVSTVPAWITGCTVPPYLVCDGTVYTATAVYGVGNPTPLLNLLGSTFGGNGITTFGVPDLQARVRIPLGGATGRVTTAGSGIDGTTINSGGGAQNQTLTIPQLPVFTPAFSANPTLYYSSTTAGGGNQLPGVINTLSNASPGAPLTVNLNNYAFSSIGGGAAHPIMQPTLVSGLTFIKT